VRPVRALLVLLAVAIPRPAGAGDDGPEHAWEAGGYVAVGTRTFASDAFDRVSRIPRTLGGVGWGLPFVFGRFHLKGALFIASADVPGAPGGFMLGDLQALAGWDVVRWDAMAVYVAGGAGIAVLDLDPRLVPPARLDGGNVGEVSPVATLHAGARIVAPLVRIDRSDRLALALSIDCATIRQVASGAWTQGTDGHAVAGPSVDASGASVTLRLSILVLADR
jgi:hypothetical protein